MIHACGKEVAAYFGHIIYYENLYHVLFFRLSNISLVTHGFGSVKPNILILDNWNVFQVASISLWLYSRSYNWKIYYFIDLGFRIRIIYQVYYQHNRKSMAFHTLGNTVVRKVNKYMYLLISKLMYQKKHLMAFYVISSVGELLQYDFYILYNSL